MSRKLLVLQQDLRNGAAILALALLSDCAAPDQHPFEQYSTSVKKADASLVSSLDQAISWSRDDYIQGVLKGEIKLRQTAVFQEKARFKISFSSASGPVFQEFQQNRTLLQTANAATEKYVDTLVTLASKDIISPDTFQAVAQNVDSSLNSIAKTLGQKLPNQAIPIFATASSEAMRLLIEHRRRAALVKVLQTNQRAISDYSNLCVGLLAIIDESVSKDYHNQATALVTAFQNIQNLPKQAESDASNKSDSSAQSGPVTSPSPVDLSSNANAKAIVEQLLQLNTDYRALIESLEAATKVYAKLPQGHRELLDSVQKKSTGFAAVKDIAQEGERLKAIYDTLQKSGSDSTEQKTKKG
jgi:hypothetical protein